MTIHEKKELIMVKVSAMTTLIVLSPFTVKIVSIMRFLENGKEHFAYFFPSVFSFLSSTFSEVKNILSNIKNTNLNLMPNDIIGLTGH